MSAAALLCALLARRCAHGFAGDPRARLPHSVGLLVQRLSVVLDALTAADPGEYVLRRPHSHGHAQPMSLMRVDSHVPSGTAAANGAVASDLPSDAGAGGASEGTATVASAATATTTAPALACDLLGDGPRVREDLVPYVPVSWQLPWRAPNTFPQADGDAAYCPDMVRNGSCPLHERPSTDGTFKLRSADASVVPHSVTRLVLITLTRFSGPRCPLVHVLPPRPGSTPYHYTVWCHPDELGPMLKARVESEGLSVHDNGCYRLFGLPAALQHCFTYASTGACDAQGTTVRGWPLPPRLLPPPRKATLALACLLTRTLMPWLSCCAV